MSKKIKMKIEEKTYTAILNNSRSALLLYERLPMDISMSRWGEEYYGDCGLIVDTEEDARDVLEIGEIAIWPGGNAFCIFFGPTPVSTDERPKAVAPVNPIGKIEGDTRTLNDLPHIIRIKIEPA